MYIYIGVAAAVLVLFIVLYYCMPAEDYKEEEISKKIEELVKVDINEARKVAKNDMKVFEALQNSK